MTTNTSLSGGGESNAQAQINAFGSTAPATGATEASSTVKITTGGVTAAQRQQDKDDIDTAKPSSSAGSAKDPGAPDSPLIPASKPFNPAAVKVNEWLTAFFMTRMAICNGEIAMMNKDIHKAEAKQIILNLDMIWVKAQFIGELIMAKAYEEAAMHMMLAIAAVASLAVAAAGSAMTITGKAKSIDAEMRMRNMDEGITPPPTARDARAGGTRDVASDQPARPVDPPPRNLRNDDASTTSSSSSSSSSSRSSDAQGNHSHEGPPPTSAKPTDPEPDVPVPPAPPPAAPAPAPADPSNTSSSSSSSSSSGSEARSNTSQGGYDSRVSSQPTTQEPPAAGVDRTPAQKVSEREKIAKQQQRGEFWAALGQSATMSTQSIQSIIENSIQAAMKPLIAEFDQDIELQRAAKDIASKMLDMAQQGFSDGTSGIDNVVKSWSELLQSVKDFSIRHG